MSSARTEILGRLKKAGRPGPRNRVLALIPKRGQAKGKDRTNMFVAEAKYSLAEVVRVQNLGSVPAAVVKILGTSLKVKVAPHPDLQGLDWTGLKVQFGRGAADDDVAVSVAFGAVAETGTLVLRSGKDAPTTLNFLPDVHVVVLHEQDIAGNYEAVWQKLLYENDQLPRTVNWITGPSRTADIEQTMLLGAHGPRKLVIL
ncbi:MAG: LUD domain-containing protein [Magnetovibrio sp.]|nr:LUD domain-containing protein [Magnetovibrio sp.]